MSDQTRQNERNHQHSNESRDDYCHQSGHDHSHESGDDHSHEGGDEESPAPFLLKYMLEHNTHHAEELHKLVQQLREVGSIESAAAVERALQFYEQGNVELASAVEQLEVIEGT